MHRIYAILLALLLAGCGATGALQPVEVTRLVPQRETVEVTRLVERTVIVTATALPPTDTPIPPTPTPPYARWTPDQVVAAFQAAGLEVGPFHAMTAADYGTAPQMASAGIRFLLPSLCADCGGRVLAFNDAPGLDATRTYYETLGKNKLYFSWVFVHDNLLVQINGDLPEARAKVYQAALEALH